MDVESFTFHSTVVSSGLEHRLCVCGSRVRGIFLVNPGEMTSSAIIPGPLLASGTAGVRLCVWTQNPFFSPSQTDCIQDNNTYSPAHRCKYNVAECVCMCACPIHAASCVQLQRLTTNWHKSHLPFRATRTEKNWRRNTESCWDRRCWLCVRLDGSLRKCVAFTDILRTHVVTFVSSEPDTWAYLAAANTSLI